MGAARARMMSGAAECFQDSNYPLSFAPSNPYPWLGRSVAMRTPLVAGLLSLALVSAPAAAGPAFYVGPIEIVRLGATAEALVKDQAVANLGLMMDKNGKVAGYLDGRNCDIVGRWENRSLPRFKTLSAGFSRCSNSSMNGPWKGRYEMRDKGIFVDLTFSRMVGMGQYENVSIRGLLTRKPH